jgi:hypothetical protein
MDQVAERPRKILTLATPRQIAPVTPMTLTPRIDAPTPCRASCSRESAPPRPARPPAGSLSLDNRQLMRLRVRPRRR